MADILLTAEASSDDEDPNTPTTIDRFFALIEHLKPDSYACRTYKGLKLAGKGRTMNSILVSCAVRLMPFNLPVIRELMWRDEMEIDRIPFEGTNLFVVADDAGGQLDFVLAMFYQQTFRTLYNIADNLPGERFPVPVVSFIDEMLNMGNIPYKERILMTARSRNMPIVMGLQSMDLAKEKWGENILGAILDACDTIVYMGGGRSKESRAYISESLGTQTVYEHTVSETVSARSWAATIPLSRRTSRSAARCSTRPRSTRYRGSSASSTSRAPRPSWWASTARRTRTSTRTRPSRPTEGARPSQGPSLCRREGAQREGAGIPCRLTTWKGPGPSPTVRGPRSDHGRNEAALTKEMIFERNGT